jgi:hypothetical protein
MNKISDDPYSNLVLVDNGSLQPQSPGITQLYIHAYINTTVLKMDVLRTAIQKGMFMENAICMMYHLAKTNHPECSVILYL